MTETRQEPTPLKKKPWTHTNSDEQCLTNVHNPFSRFLYVVSLKTGYYSIETTDQRLSLLFAILLLLVSALMCHVLVQGVRDGFDAGHMSAVPSAHVHAEEAL